MIEVLNWFAEHPWMTILLTICAVCIVGALGASIGEILRRGNDW